MLETLWSLDVYEWDPNFWAVASGIKYSGQYIAMIWVQYTVFLPMVQEIWRKRMKTDGRHCIEALIHNTLPSFNACDRQVLMPIHEITTGKHRQWQLEDYGDVYENRSRWKSCCGGI
jgi:hypothetical protein